jgi:xanthine dehydrogenase small subunit
VTATDATATTADVPCVRPRTLAEALAARATHPDWLVVAGGTDLMVGALHRAPPAGVIDVFGIRELQGIHRLELKVRIGAGTTYAKLLEHTLVSRVLPSLHQACAEVGAVQIQARGTLGGNMATSSPVGDTLPCLLALDATVVLVSATNGERRVPYHAFCTGYRKVDLREDELIVAVEVPEPIPGTVQVWRKVGTRKAQAISKVMLAATGYVDAAGRISRARVALGAVADRPLRLRAVEALLLGQRPDEAHDAVCAAITPITDVRSTKEYRLDVAARLVAGFVRTLEERAGP